MTKETVHLAIITHRYGTDAYVARTAEDLDAKLAGYCRQSWGDVQADIAPDLSKDEGGAPADRLTSREIIDTYFEAMGNSEGYETSTAELDD